MRVPNGSLIRTFPGSPAYSAEEVLFRQPHTLNVDIFALGTSLYCMLTGSFPFCNPETDNLVDLCRNVASLKLNFPPFVSADAQDLIRKLLQRADQRIDWTGIWAHPWLCAQRPAPKTRSELIASDSLMRELRSHFGQDDSTGAEPVGPMIGSSSAQRLTRSACSWYSEHEEVAGRRGLRTTMFDCRNSLRRSGYSDCYTRSPKEAPEC